MSTETPPLDLDDKDAVLASLQAQGLAPADEPETPAPVVPPAEPAPAAEAPKPTEPETPDVPATDAPNVEEPAAEAPKPWKPRARFQHKDLEFDPEDPEQQKRVKELLELGLKREQEERNFQKELEERVTKEARASSQRTIAWFQNHGIAVIPDVDEQGNQRKDALGMPLWKPDIRVPHAAPAAAPAAPAQPAAPETIPALKHFEAVRKHAVETEDPGLLQAVEATEAALREALSGLKPTEALTEAQARKLAAEEAKRARDEWEASMRQQTQEAAQAQAEEAATKALRDACAAQVARYEAVFKATANPDHWRQEAMKRAEAAALASGVQFINEAVPFMAGAVGGLATTLTQERETLLKSVATNQQPRVAAPPVPAGGGVPANEPNELNTKDPQAVLAYLQRQGLAPTG